MSLDARERLIVVLKIASLGLFAMSAEAQTLFAEPILDTTSQIHIIKGQKYAIPRNFYAGRPGDRSVISFRAYAPDITGLTQQDLPCLDFRNPCHDRGIIVGLQAGEYPANSMVLQNIRDQSYPDPRTGPCGFEYYESTGHPAHRLIYFFKRMPDASDVSIMRCSKDNSQIRGLCNSAENIGDGNRFYFVMAVSRLCEWPELRSKILDRIAVFRKAGAK